MAWLVCTLVPSSDIFPIFDIQVSFMSAGPRGRPAGALMFERSTCDQSFQELSQRLCRKFFPSSALDYLLRSHHLSVTTVSLNTNSSFVAHMYSSPDMSHSSSSSASPSFQSLFTAAVQEYANQTGTTLDDHPLANF